MPLVFVPFVYAVGGVLLMGLKGLADGSWGELYMPGVRVLTKIEFARLVSGEAEEGVFSGPTWLTMESRRFN
jgi:hypothetical protein